MKKHLLKAIVVALALVFTFSLLTACNNKGDQNTQDTPDTGVTFTSSMSKEEIIAELGKVENLAWELYINGERYYNFTQYLGTNYAVTVQSNGDEHYFDIEFVEDNRLYDLQALSGSDDDYEDIDIVDYSGYDCDFNPLRSTVNYLIKNINEGNYVVENGNIKVEETGTSDGETETYIFKNFNTTTMPELPEALKGYKTMEATADAVKYELKDDKYYEVSFADYYIKSFEVSAEYNGKPVKQFNYNCYAPYLKTVTLPTSIEYLKVNCSHDAEDGELLIIYQGTKAQWEAIKNSDVWSKTEGVRITCSDGDYVVSAEE